MKMYILIDISISAKGGGWVNFRKIKGFLLRLAALLPGLALLLFCLPPSSAAPDVIFTAVNDTFLRGLSPSSMPTVVGGQAYVPYTTFTAAPNPGLIGKYDGVNNQLVLYNINRILTFDMANAITRDEQGTVYSAGAIRRNGTYYVPARVVCEAFGFRYSFIPGNLLGPIVRINTDGSGLSDDYLVSRGFSVMRTIYDQYQRDYGAPAEEPEPSDSDPQPDPPETPPEQPDPDDGLAGKVVYLAIVGDVNEHTARILDILDANRYPAAFFVTPRAQGENADYLLRAAASGHVVGVNLYGEGSSFDSAEQLLAQAQDVQQVIQAVTRTRARALMVPGGSASLTQEQRDALIQAGYRLWDGSGQTDLWAPANDIYSASLSQLRRAPGNAVICLGNNPAGAQALSSLASFFRAHDIEVRLLSETATPVNQIQEMR